MTAVCRCSGFGAGGVTPNAAWSPSFLGMGEVVSTSGGGGGHGAGACACRHATPILGRGMGGVGVLSFVRICRVGLGLCSNPGAAQGSIGQGKVEGNAAGGNGAMMDGDRRNVRRSELLSCCAVDPCRTERLRDMG